MENDFSEKLQSILSNPQAMAQISSIAASMGLNSAADSLPSQETAADQEDIPQLSSPLQGIQALQGQLTNNDPRIALLASVKPLLREEKRQKVESLITALSMANLLKGFKK